MNEEQPNLSDENEIPEEWRDIMAEKEKTTTEELRDAQDRCFNASHDVFEIPYNYLNRLGENSTNYSEQQLKDFSDSANSIRDYYLNLTNDYINLILHATFDGKAVNGLPSISNLNDTFLTKERRLEKIEGLDGTLQNSIKNIITTIDPESYSDETIGLCQEFCVS